MTVRQGSRTLNERQLQELTVAFSRIKAEEDELLTRHPSAIFVSTESFRRIEERHKCLVVGRKGSGKSALTQTYLKLNRGRFQQAIALQADKLMFERICNLLFAGQAAHAELRVSADRVATTAWIRSLGLFAILRACEWLMERRVSLENSDRDTLLMAREAILREFSPMLADPEGDDHGRFHSLIEKALGFFSQLTDHLTTIPEQRAMVKAEQLKQFFAPVPPLFASALEIIKASGYRLLITLDEFDDFVDSYMLSNPMMQRRDTLANLFKGLVIAVRRLNADAQMAWLHLLIAVPEDKLLELSLRERATVESFTIPISWKRGELKECVERRLTHVLSMETVWEDLFPFQVSNKNPKVRTKEDSFNYLVRHTNRKPREMMGYLRSLFEAIMVSGRAADESVFQKTVEATAEQIVEQQFLPEYLPEYPNLGRLFTRLRGARLRTVMSYDELAHYVGGWSPWDDGEPLNPPDVLVRLFQLGVVGLREVSPRETARTVRQLGNNVIYHYSFNGSSTAEFHGAIKEAVEGQASSRGASTFELIFSPLFFEYLRLRHDEPYVVNQLS